MNCSQCFKLPELCICSEIKSISNQVHVLILQHPQEPDKDLGSARIANLALAESTLKVGLSWPNLKAALGREASNQSWAVLYLGSGVKGKVENTPLQFVSRKTTPIAAPKKIEGIVILDGTWSQAKALWWRNAWLLKLQRAVLIPTQPSLYKELRREPRAECLSTIETIAETLSALGEPPNTGSELRKLFSTLLNKKRAQLAQRKTKKAAEI
jgi:DTW domain-containing protein YfiP